jgi:hypothetical protein
MAAAIWVPILALVAWDIKVASTVDPVIIAYGALLAGTAMLAASVWRFSDLYKWLCRFRDRFVSPLYGVVIAGATLGIAWSIVNTIAPLVVNGWLSTPAVDPDVRLALFSIVLILMMAYLMWSYATLRSRAVRDAFDLP